MCRGDGSVDTFCKTKTGAAAPVFFAFNHMYDRSDHVGLKCLEYVVYVIFCMDVKIYRL